MLDALQHGGEDLRAGGGRRYPHLQIDTIIRLIPTKHGLFPGAPVWPAPSHPARSVPSALEWSAAERSVGGTAFRMPPVGEKLVRIRARRSHLELAVEAARAAQRRVHRLRPVGGGHHHNPPKAAYPPAKRTPPQRHPM